MFFPDGRASELLLKVGEGAKYDLLLEEAPPWLTPMRQGNFEMYTL